MKERFTYDSAKIKELLDGVYSGSITEYNIPEDLYHDIASYLKSGLYQGFGGNLTDFKGKDLELLKDLRENVYAFSGGKAYQQIKEYRSLLLNEAGEIRPQKEFTQLGEKAFETWNEAWGLTERGTAIHAAQMANKWNEIEKNKDLLPVLVYSTIGDACDICAPLDGMTAKVDDPIWNSVMAPNHFNCLCIVLQEEDTELTSESEKNNTFDKVTAEMNDTFKYNPGKDREIFSKDHPYFDVPKKDIPFAKENFGLPIPSAQEEIKQIQSNLSIKEAEKIMKELPMSKDELKALKDYTGGGYNQINGYERGIRKTITEESRQTSKVLDKFIENAPKVNAETYRGMSLEENMFDKYKTLKKGDAFMDNGFMSTSYDKKCADTFVTGDRRLEMTIKGKNGVLIEPFSQYGAAEKEVLFARGSNFKVESIKVEGDGKRMMRGIYGKIKMTLVEI